MRGCHSQHRYKRGPDEKHNKIVLMGNPNVGKSVVFSRLTGAHVITSNYAGTTVDFCHGHMRVEGRKFDIVDAPGTYSLQPTNKAEEVAVEMLDQAEVVVNVVDSTNLERNLFLTLELLEGNKPVIVSLNLWDETKHLGIEIDVTELERLLRVPVVPTVAITGEGISELVKKMSAAESPTEFRPTSDEEKWRRIGQIIEKVQKVAYKGHTLSERLADATIKPLTGIPIALGVVFLAFWFVRLVGEGLITFVTEPAFELARPSLMGLSVDLGSSGTAHDILIGRLINGDIDFLQSLGVLTTGLYVPFGMVLPYIIAFYLMLAVMEDTGYLPRLATLSDNVFHKLGMHGHGIVTVFLGLGCNVPGTLATRNLETRKQRFIAVTLLAISVPCAAQMAMIFGILGPRGVIYILIVLATLFMVYNCTGLILNRFVKGESPEIFLEIPPYRRPGLRVVLKKTWMRVRWFLREAVPFMFAGVLLVNILVATGVFEHVINLFSPLMEGLLGLPGEATPVLVIGFLRKDMAVGMLYPLGLSAMQLVIAVTMLTMYFPCVATFVVIFKELGLKDLIKASCVMVGMALLVGTIMRLILIGV